MIRYGVDTRRVISREGWTWFPVEGNHAQAYIFAAGVQIPPFAPVRPSIVPSAFPRENENLNRRVGPYFSMRYGVDNRRVISPEGSISHFE